MPVVRTGEHMDALLVLSGADEMAREAETGWCRALPNDDMRPLELLIEEGIERETGAEEEESGEEG
jgi:hypothetical protein